MLNRRFARYAWGVVGFNLLVILWGAFVRASGSGAGCGSHWPLCNGEVVPQAPQIETMIEFSHRLTSGGALLLVLGMLIWAWRAYPRGHVVRSGAAISMGFMVVEALIGAALVLLGLVADNASLWRALILAFHLVNTFLLLGALTLTAWWASGGRPLELRGRGPLLALLVPGLLGVLVVGSSGAVTALGDTLLLNGALPGGVGQPLGQASDPLVQMRVIHPILGMLVGLYTLFLARSVVQRAPTPTVRRFGIALVVLFLAQILGGGLNVTLKAPVAMQLIHLLMADLVWMALVLLSAEALASSQPSPVAQPGAEARAPRKAPIG
jgi:heme a synthase